MLGFVRLRRSGVKYIMQSRLMVVLGKGFSCGSWVVFIGSVGNLGV
jgi:hypothetical protein